MTEKIEGPISKSKALAIPKQEAGKAIGSVVVKEIFALAVEEKPAIPVSTRIPPSLNRLVEELILHPKLPWTDKSDFLRSAIYTLAKGTAYLMQTQNLDTGKLMPFLAKLGALQLEAERNLALKRTNDAVGDINESLDLFIEEEAWDDLLDELEKYAKLLNERTSDFYDKLAIRKFFMQSNVAKALQVFQQQGKPLPPQLKLALKKFRGLK